VAYESAVAMNDTPDSYNNVIILQPDIEKLNADIKKLRTELSIIVLECAKP
jgi:hypothetical protein